MQYKLPFTIESGHGERIIFKEIVSEPDGDKVMLEGYCTPNSGPTMHVHYMQDEGMAVRQGTMAYQILGQNPVHIGPGESVVFSRNQAHRFWNAGADELIVDGWVKPANSIIFFLATLYEAMRKSGSGRPDAFDGAYLLTRYKGEYGMPELPAFVKNIIVPTTYRFGRLLGKYKKFKGAPAPL